MSSILGRRASRLISRRNKSQPVTVTKNNGSRNSVGRWVVGVPTTEEFMATMLPADGNTYQEVEEGRRVVDVQILWIETLTRDAITPLTNFDKDSDTVTAGGLEWIVYKIKDYSHHGHIEAVIYRRSDQADA